MIPRLRFLARHLSRARMSTVHNTNQACCTIPPVVTDDYTLKGSYKAHGSFKKVYVTGPDISDNAIVCVFDIFGYFPQTQQGADIIASTLKTTVYMPDFFEPNPPFPAEKYPPTSDSAKKELQSFFGGTANPQKATEKLKTFGELLKSSGAKKVGVYGFCWGGKVTISASGDSTPFDAASIIHPAMLSADDASKLTIPLAMYISKDEPVEEYNKVVDVISKKPFAAKNDYKNYTNMHHGWAAARANLKNEENQKSFEEVYSKLATFFQSTLV